MKWKLSLSFLKELLKWWRNSIYSISISLFVLEILRFVWYVNNTVYVILYNGCWENMYMIEIILLNQSKLSLLGIIKTNTPYMRSFVWLCLITSTIFLLLLLFNVTYAACYLHIKQIAISRERRAIWKNCTWSSFTISRVLSNKTNLIFISYTL